MSKPRCISILLVEDDHIDAKIMHQILQSIKLYCYDIIHIDKLKQLENIHEEKYFDVILLDVSLPPGHDLTQALNSITKYFPSIPVIALDTEFNEEMAIKTAQLGVQDYLYKKDLNETIFERVIRYAIERNKFIKEIHLSEERERHLLNAAGEGIIGIDTSGNCTFINPAGLSMLGYQHEDELLGKHLHPIIHHTRTDGSHCPDEECNIYKAFRKSISIHVEDDMFWRSDNTSLPVDYRSMPLKIDGKISGSVVTFSDITERKNMLSDLISAQEYLEERVRERTQHLQTANELLKKESQERQQAQQARRKSDEFSTALIETSGALIIVLDSNGHIVRFNAALEKTTGYKFREVAGKLIWNVLIPEDEHDKGHAVFEELIKKRQPNTHKGYITSKTGERRYITWSNTVLIDENREVDYIIGMGLDMTDQHAFEQALKESESKFRGLTEESMVGVYLIQDGKFQYINPQLSNIMGQSETELLDRNAINFILKKDRRALIRTIRKQANRNSSTFHTTFHCHHKTGKVLDIESYGSITIYKSKPAIIGTVLDITKRKIIEQALQDQMLRYEQILQTSIDGFLLISAQGKILDANPAYCKMLGYSISEILDLNITDIELNLSPQSLYNRMDLLSEQGLTSYEAQNLRKDNRIIDIEASISSVTSNNTTIAAIFARDITERKRQEVTEKQSLLDLAHASRLSTMGEMATELAHELNQPLSAISTYSDVAQRLLTAININDEDLSEAIKGIHNQSHRAGEIIHSLRDFIGKQESCVSLTDINELIRLVIRLVKSEISINQVEVVLELDESLPEIVIEKILIEQVLLNLTRNAIEAMIEHPDTYRKLLIRTSINSNNMIQVNIEDTGPGLPYTDPDHVFGAFYSTKSQGMGMGLTICRSIIESHEGKLWAVNKKPHGAKFSFSLPLSLDEIEQ